ncbi:solute carrier family 49 member 4 homolog [Aplysia californica]|uniref:Solute carrier family 49 member 4 homolog n=1 Tax=Aplysia californica TaxID=6500 RepID=A0ABM1A7N2_APLCA|nr:solute carrier family 49 member 4 homolog [Aplysia californica]
MDGSEERPLLGHRRGEDGGEREELYYDSFPSPVSELDRPITSKEEEKPKVEDVEIKVYKRRWYILIIFGLFSMTQNGVWNTWGPISTTSIEALGWDNSTIAWLSNWGPISFIMVGLFYPWLLQVKGLRWAVVSSALLVAAGTSLRVITSDPEPATVLIHCGQFLNGVAGPMAMGAIPALSSSWFPPHERVTATAVGASIGMFGLAITFVLGPELVKGGPPDNTTSSITTTSPHMISSSGCSLDVYEPANVTDARIHREREDIMKYMYYQCGWAWLVALCLLCYFPAKPPRPPCASASVERDRYWAGLWSLRKYSTAGWIGCYSTIAACAFSLFIGRFADYFTRSIKFFILVLYILGTACFLVFALMLIKVIPYSDITLYSTIIGGTTLLNGAVPLMFELACELAYPTGEGAANGFLTYLNNLGGLVFLAVFSFPNVGTMWMNWALIGSTVVCVPLIGALRGRFNRLEVDEGVQTQGYVEQEVNVEADSGENGYSIQSESTNLLSH